MPARMRSDAQAPTMLVAVGARRSTARAQIVVGQVAGEGLDVLAAVGLLGQRLALAACRHGRAQDAHLAPGVVEVVLARDLLPAGLQDAAQQVADERAAGVAHGQRPGRVGRHELHVDVRGRPGGHAPERVARRARPVEGPLQEGARAGAG